jgi:hypothetical protein
MVVVIIGILVGLLFPLLEKARQSARIKKSKAEINELTKAWQTYWLTYQKWPSFAGSPPNQFYDGPVSADIVKILQGNNAAENRLGTKFLDLPPKAAVEGHCDPWGNVYKFGVGTGDVSNQWNYAIRVHLANDRRYLR